MNSTANATDRNIQASTGQVIPFRHAELLLVDNSGEPFVPMKPVVEGMGLTWQAQHRKLMTGRFAPTITEMVIVAGDGKQREMTCLPLRKLAGWLMSIHPAKAREELRAGIIAYQNECDDALWSFWNEGKAVRHDSRSAETVLSATIGTTGFNMLGALIKGKVVGLPLVSRHQATSKIWSQTHTAFGVRSAADIPASQLDAARNFIAAYALEGEWLAKEPEITGPVLSRADLLNLNALTHYMGRVREIYVRYNMFNALGALGSRAGVELHDYVADGNAVAGSLRSKFKAEIARATADADAAGKHAIAGLAAA